jgi:GNAT superfamily N-acetyltransferase
VVPPLAAAFGPDIVVSQHGADGHFWDPLAHLLLTTTAMGEAARLVDRIAHRYAGGRWLATGGGGYAVYRVVPRVWALTWLAGAHLETPGRLPAEWRARWEGDASRWDDSQLPDEFEDGPEADGMVGAPAGYRAEAAAEEAKTTVRLVRTVLMPALLSVAGDRGWWRFDGPLPESLTRAGPAAEAPLARGEPTVLAPLTTKTLDRLSLAPRVIAPVDTAAAAAILRAAFLDGAVAAGAVIGEWLVGVALAVPGEVEGVDRLVALGVAPEWRKGGIATALLRALVEEQDRRGRALVALHSAAERDPIDPLPRAVRRGVAEALAAGSGMTSIPAPPRVLEVDPGAILALRLPPGSGPQIEARLAEWAASL